MRSSSIPAFVLMGIIVLASPRQSLQAQVLIEPTAENLTAQDQNFLEAALIAARHVTAVSLVAAQRAQDSGIKAYADQLAIDSQTRANELVELLGAGSAAALPQVMRPLAELDQLEPGAFDPAFVAHLAEVHRRELARFEAAAQAEGQSQAVRDFASRALPALREEAERGEDL